MPALRCSLAQGLDGDAIDRATDAILFALIDFLPKRTVRDKMRVKFEAELHKLNAPAEPAEVN